MGGRDEGNKLDGKLAEGTWRLMGEKTLVKGMFQSSQQETETMRSDIDPL